MEYWNNGILRIKMDEVDAQFVQMSKRIEQMLCQHKPFVHRRLNLFDPAIT